MADLTYITDDGWEVEIIELHMLGMKTVHHMVSRKVRLCGSCEGEGKVIIPNPDEYSFTMEIPCEFCQGTGRLFTE